MLSVDITKIKPNKHILAMNVVQNNLKLAKAGMILDSKLISRLKQHNITAVYVSNALHEFKELDDFIDNTTFNNVRAAMKGKNNIDNLKTACKQLTKCVVHTTLLDAPLTRMVTKQNDIDNLLEHSINTACYAGIIAAASGKSQTIVNKYVTAGILHDIGKTVLPNVILFSPKGLSNTERTIMNQHPIMGYELLKDYNWVTEDIRRSVLEHHENYDGTGYPLGRRGDEISDIGHVLHIADVFDALVRSRSYKQGWQPSAAREYIIAGKGEKFHPDYVDIFMENMPVYEAGTLVRLSNDGLAVVIRNTQGHVLEPVVLPVDGTEELDTSKSEIKVVALVTC